jgi:PAS domain S-box-containing protein
MTRQLRVLVVAADADTRSRTATALRRVGAFSVSTTSDSDSIPDRVGETDSHAAVGDDRTDRAVDCVVADHTPPAVNALELARAGDESQSAVPVVLFPADGSERLAGEALAAGVDGYVPNTGADDDYETLAERVHAVATAHHDRVAHEERFEYYRAIVETMLDGAHIIDDSGERVYFNGRSSFVHDIDEDRLLTEAPQVFVEEGIMSQADLDRYGTVVGELLDGVRDTARVEMSLDLPNSGERTVETRLTRLDGERLRGVVGTTRDVTDRVRTERRLAARNDQLTNLARFFSHDLRNPLNVAAGYATLARETGETEHFDRLDDALDRMDSLVDDLLALTTRTVGELDRTDVSLPVAARQAWENVDTEDATLAVDTDSVVRANEGLLLRLFENLFRNAVEHGGPTVTVTIRDVDGGFVVDDDGTGFPANREELLDLGVSGGEGTGLGLAIVAENADAHDWSVALEESPDGGARIEFDLTQSETTPLTPESSAKQ